MGRSIHDILQAGLILRWWCFACARGDEIAREELADAWFLDLAEIAVLCPSCRRTDDVVALPAGSPPAPEPDETAQLTPEDAVAFLFHAARSAGKKRGRRR